MARRCEICGKGPARGTIIHRRGQAKKKGGIGQHVTANT
ncbi:MAG: 50S ribosomal protein L28, partial [Verrucomicrobiae bacterium]|nr:50S ribosomal protein L28 [Verrucomicrobiae bacterium]